MADWFKFYENGLDEPRFQYAVGTLSEVTPVWVGILSECCRHKSDTINWNDDEAYLFGFSRRLNVSIPKVNEALNLLKRIAYIEVVNGTLKVIKWNEFQSEYMKRKDRESPKRLRTVSEHTPNTLRQEESRVEENIGEGEASKKSTPLVNGSLPPFLRISKEQELKRARERIAKLKAQDSRSPSEVSDLKKFREREARLLSELEMVA